MICVDLGPQAQDKAGDAVVLWGEGLPVERIAEITKVSAYELITRLTSRVAMKYLDYASGVPDSTEADPVRTRPAALKKWFILLRGHFPSTSSRPAVISGLLCKNPPHANLGDTSRVSKVDAYAGDPILSLMERFKEDPRSDKVNLSIGLYYNDDGIIPQLQAVAEAEARLNAEPHGASLYLPMEGLSGYRQAIAPLLFGAEHTALKQNRIASIQTVGGSGALKVGADFLKRYFPESHVWVSDPTPGKPHRHF